MNGLLPRPLKVEQDFTDTRLTGFEGWSADASHHGKVPLLIVVTNFHAQQTASRVEDCQPLEPAAGD